MHATRRRRILPLLLGSALALSLAGCGAEVTVADEPGSTETRTIEDELGRTVDLPDEVDRAVVLGSYDVDIVAALGGADRIVGTDANSYEMAKKSGRADDLEWEGDIVVAQDATTGDLNHEEIIAKDPDVVVLFENSDWENAAERLEPLGIPVVIASGWKYETFDSVVTVLGDVFGAPDRAEEILSFKQDLQSEIDARLPEEDQRRSVYYENEVPNQTPTKGSGFFEAIESAGGDNIFDDLVWGEDGVTQGSVWKTPIDPVDIIQRDPELVIFEFGNDVLPTTEDVFAEQAQTLTSRAGWESLAAYETDDIYLLNAFVAGQLGKQFLTAYAATWLYPEEFADFPVDDYARTYVEDYLGIEFAGSDGVYVEHVGAGTE